MGVSNIMERMVNLEVKIVEIVNSFEFEEAKRFYKKVRAKIYKNMI